jgi:hypothetical protein
MQRRSNSPLIRYWLARFRPLTRPRVWGPLTLMFLAGLFAWELSTKPDWLPTWGQSPTTATSGLSTEDQGIAADIDTLPLLLNDFGLTVPGAEDANEANPAKPAGSSGALAGIPLVGAAAPPAAPSSKSDVTQPDGLTKLLTDGQALGNSNRMALGAGVTSQDIAQSGLHLLQPSAAAPSALATALAQTQGTAPQPNQSALAAAVARYPSEGLNSPDPNRLTVNPLAPLNSLPQPPLEGTTSLSNGNQAPGVPLSGSTSLSGGSIPIAPADNAFGNLTGGQGGNSVGPNGFAPVQPAGLVPNPAPVGTINPAGTNLGPTPSAGQPNPAAGIVPADGTNQAIQANPQPFSVPRPVPGRSIGGGRINTFSNP